MLGFVPASVLRNSHKFLSFQGEIIPAGHSFNQPGVVLLRA